jgi:hypothetical protein
MSSYRQAGTVLADRTFSVPLDHDRPEGERIEIFAREIVAADRASAGPALAALPPGRARVRRPAPATAGSAARSTTTGCCCQGRAGP